MARFIFVFIVFAHGLIHTMGMANAFHIGNLSQLTKDISKTQGILWLVTATLFILAGLAFLLKKELWWLVGFVAVVVSQYLIVTVWTDAKFGTVANSFILLVSSISFASWHYHQRFLADVKQNLSQTANISNELLTQKDIDHLPQIVQKYIYYTHSVGKPKVNNFRVRFDGKIRAKDDAEWMPFTSEQYNFLAVPSRLFFMKATMKNLPVGGYHNYTKGNAFMDIRLLSIFSVQYFSGNDMNIAETVTFFNDMCVMAPATLIDKRITWNVIEPLKINACFHYQGISISANLFFNEKGELINFESYDRYNASESKKMRWTTPIKSYAAINGYRLGTYAETVYSYPDRDFIYGTFRMTSVAYNITKID